VLQAGGMRVAACGKAQGLRHLKGHYQFFVHDAISIFQNAIIVQLSKKITSGTPILRFISYDALSSI
jgi:hypothetical protein